MRCQIYSIYFCSVLNFQGCKYKVFTKIIRVELLIIPGNCEIINEYCLNGTDRIILYLKKNKTLQKCTVVNVQGDEPFINHKNIQLAIDNYINCEKLKDKIVCSTLFYKTLNKKEILSKSRGKMVINLAGNIMYCSRNIIPTNKKNNIIPNHNYNIHVGIFVFNSDYLLNHYYNTNTPLQLAEDIEWMKIIEQGFKINAVEIKDHEIGVDTIEDYNYLKNKYK